MAISELFINHKKHLCLADRMSLQDCGSLKTEYEVEEIFINQLEKEQGYSYIDMANYDDVLANFRVQFCKVNEKALIDAKGVAERI